ncbi:MAG: hypothetical protein ABI729_04855 [Chitinophagales bacterium]
MKQNHDLHLSPIKKLKTLLLVNFLFHFLLTFYACTYSSTFSDSVSGYDLAKPDKTMILPDTLREISDLTEINNTTIACIQDENGILFIYDVLQNNIKQQYNFHVDGDYEGIARVGKTIYILRSDGALFEISDYETANFKLGTYVTGIPADNEGLCYDADNNRLLIACKSKLEKGAAYKDKRMIYGFDLSTKALTSEPVFTFDLVTIKQFAQEKKLNLPERNNKNGSDPALKFSPSAIAIHPFSKKIYLLSAAGYMLFIFDRQGTLEHIEQLNPKIFNKAEGITFFSNGDMLITNEGQDRKPTLLVFNYRN